MDADEVSLFETRILPKLGVTEGGVDRPRWIFIGGQQGSGKTTLRRRLADALGPNRTQMISGDDFNALVPELSLVPDGPDTPRSVLRKLRMSWTERLIERAWTLQAHVIWEQPTPNYAIEFATIARELGYCVECQVLAFPLPESWLAAARRNLSVPEPTGPKPPILWTRLAEAYHRWPAFLAQAEARLAFDRITVLDRQGQSHFENEIRKTSGKPGWKNPAFAFESLLVERNQPRSPAEIMALFSALDALLSDPRLASDGRFADRRGCLQAVAETLQDMRADPATGFDLNQPDPALASGWINRVRREFQATMASPEGVGFKPLAARGDRLFHLVAQVAGQPQP